MKLKSGKEEIVYLLNRVIEKFEMQTGLRVARNSNRKNYEEVAKTLSAISNELPHTATSLQHEAYPPDYNPKKLDYPFRKYDITGNQVKDAFFNQIVANPRSFLVDACYIYLYGVGRKGFEQNPVDKELLQDESTAPGQDVPTQSVSTKEASLAKKTTGIKKSIFWSTTLVLLLALLGVLFLWRDGQAKWKGVQSDMKILPYKPTKAEIDSLEGIWLCYTGSPQARISDSNRFHLVVSNILDVQYKDGYFTFTRYGASFDHEGYMQYEAPWLVSIHSFVRNNSDSIQSPRHSLMRLDMSSPFISVISASWNFDAGARNQVIGIREVYVKQGKGGRVEEVINTLENASCRCKIINWSDKDRQLKTFQLRNELLDTFQNAQLKELLNERSILLRDPNDGLILLRDSSKL
jgi:hypothetical protein